MRLPRSVRDADVAGKRVLVRADLNVPLEDGQVADDTRIRASLPTLQLLLERGAAEVRVCSHLGRPKGDEDREVLDGARRGAARASCCPTSAIDVLENTRFDPGETKNDPAFAHELAEGCDLYVERRVRLGAPRALLDRGRRAPAARLRRAAAARAELEHLGKLLGEVERPFVLVSGGAKVEDKLGVLQNLGGARGHRADRREDGRAGARREPARLRRRAADGRRRRRRVRGGRRVGRLRRRRPARRLARPRHRPGDARALRASDRRRADDLLERADGRLRVAALRRGDEGGRAGGGRTRRVLGRRRRRLRARDRTSSGSRTRSRGSRPAAAPPRAARGQGAARRRRDPVGGS